MLYISTAPCTKQAGQRIPGYSSAMGIAITKRTESSKTKLEKWVTALSRSQLTKFT